MGPRLSGPRDHALLWIVGNQLGRRNLSDDPRAVIALSVAERRSRMAHEGRAKVAAEKRWENECWSDTSTDKHDRPSMTAGVERVDGDFHWVTRCDGQIVESRPLTQDQRTWRFEDTGEALRSPTKKRDTRAKVAEESKVSERKLCSAAEIKKADPVAAERIRRGESTRSRSARS